MGSPDSLQNNGTLMAGRPVKLAVSVLRPFGGGGGGPWESRVFFFFQIFFFFFFFSLLVLMYIHAIELNEKCKIAFGMALGQRIARDITDGDPERMAPLKVADYVDESFQGVDNVQVNIERDRSVINSKYPLLSAVSRTSVDRHAPAVIELEYNVDNPILVFISLAMFDFVKLRILLFYI